MFDDTTGGNARLLDGKGTALDDFLDFQTIAFVIGVEEQSQTSGFQRRSVRIVASSCVRAVQLAEHFAQHVAEVVVVVDVGQETLVDLAITLPVYTMNLRVVEFVGHLTPYMVEKVLALLIGLPGKRSLKADGLGLVLGEVEFLDAPRYEEEILEVLVGFHVATSHAFHDEFRFLFAHRMAPEVVAVLEGHLIVQGVTAWRENGVAQMSGIGREADNTVAGIVQVELQGWLLRLGGWLDFGVLAFGFCIFVGVLLGLLSLFLCIVIKRLLLFAHTETLVGIQVEEHDVDILLGSPTAVTAIACTVAGIDDGLAVQCPFGVGVAVAAIGQIVHLAIA